MSQGRRAAHPLRLWILQPIIKIGTQSSRSLRGRVSMQPTALGPYAAGVAISVALGLFEKLFSKGFLVPRTTAPEQTTHK
jgi:hypothetical protein